MGRVVTVLIFYRLASLSHLCSRRPPAGLLTPTSAAWAILERSVPSTATSLASTGPPPSVGSSTQPPSDIDPASPVFKMAEGSDEKHAEEAPAGMRAVGKARPVLPPKVRNGKIVYGLL